MVCGVDVYHDSTSHFNSVVGFVSSMNSTCSRWYSSVKMQSSGEEIINCLNECFYKALNKYLSVRHYNEVYLFFINIMIPSLIVYICLQ